MIVNHPTDSHYFVNINRYAKGFLVRKQSWVNMMWFLFTTLKFCAHLITLIIETCEGRSRRNLRSQGTQTDVSIYPLCKNSAYRNTRTFPTPKARGFSVSTGTAKREAVDPEGLRLRQPNVQSVANQWSSERHTVEWQLLDAHSGQNAMGTN